MTYKTILEKLNKLMSINENKAKDAFIKIFDEPLLYKELKADEIEALFNSINFSIDNGKTKLKAMCSRTFALRVNDTVQRNLFLKVLIENSRKEILINEDFDFLIQRHVESDFFINQEYIIVLYNLRKYISDDALIYALTSDSILGIDHEVFSKCLKSIVLDKDTMMDKAMILLGNNNFLNQATFEEIKTLVQRVTFNLTTKKDTKFFINKLLNNKNFINHYLKVGRMIDINYLNKKQICNLNDYLIENRLYDKYLSIESKDEFYNLVGSFMKLDPNFVNYFNFNSVNDTTIKLDPDLLYGLIKSNYQDKLTMINKSSYKDIFVNCANYLNQRYPNVNVSNLIDALSSEDVSDEFIESCKDANVEMVTHYLLNSLDMKLDDINDYEYRIIDYLDKTYLNDCNLTDFKDALVLNRYGFRYSDLKDNIYYSFKQGIDKFNSPILIKEFKEFKDIIFSKDKEYLYTKYFRNSFDFNKSNKYKEDLKRLYNKSLISHLIGDDLKYNEYMPYKGSMVPLVRIDKPFKALVSAIGFAEKLEVINDNYSDSFRLNKSYNNHLISMSYYTSDSLKRVTGDFVLGYKHLPIDSIQAMAPNDIFSKATDYTVKYNGNNKFISYDEFDRYTRNGYNELVVERKNLDPNSGVFLENQYPSYVLIDNLKDSKMDIAIQASKDLDIPLVYIDKEKIMNDNLKRYQKALLDYKGENLSELINIMNMIFDQQTYGENKTIDSQVLDDVIMEFNKHKHTNCEYEIIEDYLLNEINKTSNDSYRYVYDTLIKIRKLIKIDTDNINYNITDMSPTIKTMVDEYLKKGYIAKGYNSNAYKDTLVFANLVAYLAKKCNYKDIDIAIKAAIFVSSNFGDYKYCDYVKGYNYFTLSATKHFLGASDMKIDQALNYASYDIIEDTFKNLKDLDKNYASLDTIIRACYDLSNGDNLDLISEIYNIDIKEIKEIFNKSIHLDAIEAKKVATR